jgi:outer membrane biosynthesis protein TonB
MTTEGNAGEGGGQVNTTTSPQPQTPAQQTKSTLTSDAKTETEKPSEKPKDETQPKTEEPKKEEKKPEEKKAEVAPEKYEKFVVPEGLDIDADTLGKFEAAAKELNLSQATAQKMIDISTANTQREMQKQIDNHLKQREEWVSELRADKEFGGDKFGETVDRAKRVLRNYGSESLIKFLDFSGYGDNGELIKMFAKMDKAMGEDSAVDGDAKGTRGMSAAQALYPSQNK